MACPVNLFTQLGNTLTPGIPIDSNGSWVLTSTTNPGGSLTAIVNGSTVTIPTGSAVGSGSGPSVDFEPSVDANYVFTYTVGNGSCNSTATVTITVVNGVSSGQNATITLCKNENFAYILYNFLTGGTVVPGGGQTGPGGVLVSLPGAGITGTWAGSGVGTAGYVAGTSSITDDTFNPSLAPTGGPYNFIYNTAVTGSVTCPNCQDSATIAVTVSDAPNAGTNRNITVCSAA